MMRDNGTGELAAALDGSVLEPGHAAFDEARQVWNAMIDRRPAAIVRPAHAGDVSRAIGFARDRGYLPAVRGGGHNVAGTGASDGGLLIDLSGMRGVSVDPAARVARVEGGALLSDVDKAGSAHGLATTGGVVSSTGVGGLTLGGGFGWLARRFGLAADNLLAAELVTADGEIVAVGEDENPDLLWALRGGGGNFGVVTRFDFRLHELPGKVLFGPTIFPFEDAPAVLRQYRDFCADAPRECCIWADLFTAPPLPFLPEAFHGRKVLSLMQCFAGNREQGVRLSAAVRAFGTPIADGVAPRPYTDAQSFLDQTYAHGARNYWSSQNYRKLADDIIDSVVELAATLPTPESDVLICQLGGAIDDLAPDAAAYPHRGVQFLVTPGARWRDPDEDERCIRWTRKAGARLAEGASGGAYVNFIAESRGEERSAYGANYERLRALKKVYDPDNLFRANQNVTPV